MKMKVNTNLSNKKDELDKEIDRAICCTTGKLYVMANEMGFNVEKFSDMFLSSHFCERSFDTEYSRFQTEDEDVSMDYLLREITPAKESGDMMMIEDAAFWIGYMYRRLYIDLGIPSRIIKEMVPFSYMQAKYYGLSTIDDEEAVEVIRHDCKLG